MKRCIVHVGMHKTGTTSIQQSLKNYSDESFVYADFGGHPNHSRALYGMLGFEHFMTPALEGRRKDDAIARFRRSIAKAGDRTYLISGEGISRLPPDKLRGLRDYLRESFDEITIVAAVRAPAGYMTSDFQEKLKRQQVGHIRFIRYRSYQATFRKFDEIFGRAHVKLWRFDPATYPDGCAVRDFCARFDIALPENRIVRVNESLSREALGLLYIYRKLGAEWGSLSMTGPQNVGLVRELMAIGRAPFRFSPEVINPILGANRADIAWMESRLGQSLREELGGHRAGDVRDESDLLTPDPQAVAALLALFGDDAPAGNRGDSPQDVARLVHALREKCDRQRDGSPARKLFNHVKMAFWR